MILPAVLPDFIYGSSEFQDWGFQENQAKVLKLLFNFLFLIDWWLVYNTGLVSVIQHELTIGIHTSSVQLLSHVRLFATPWTAARQASLSIINSGVYSNSCPLNWWCHPTISSSVIPFSSHLQSFPTSASFQMSQFLAAGGQSIGASATGSVLPMNIQDWFPLGWIGWISLQSKGLSRVFSNTTVQKHQFFGTQLSL